MYLAARQREWRQLYVQGRCCRKIEKNVGNDKKTLASFG